MILKIRRFIYYIFSKKTRDRLLGIRETLGCVRYYRKLSFTGRAERRNCFYFILDSNFRYHPGLADRLKAIVSCYYLSRINNYDFRIIDQTDCGIKDFLSGKGNGRFAETDELEYSLRDTRFLNFSGALCGLSYRLKPDKQYHCYCYQGDDIFLQNGADYPKLFGKYYNELFAPSQDLMRLAAETGLKEKEYVAIHARFVNSLGVFESTRYPTLSLEEREQLIERCKKTISQICKQESLPVVLFSDSALFLDRARELPVVILDTTNISHLSHNKDKSSMAKTYLDFILISRALKVIRLSSVERELHLTNYSMYAAYAGGAEASDVKV